MTYHQHTLLRPDGDVPITLGLDWCWDEGTHSEERWLAAPGWWLRSLIASDASGNNVELTDDEIERLSQRFHPENL